jgi:hypothetical protein
MATTTILGKEITALSASYALTASFALNGGGGGSTDTGSLLTTASFSNPNLTFTKGNASTFNVSLSSLVPTSASYATTSSFSDSSSLARSSTNVAITDTTTGTGPYYIAFTSNSTGNNNIRVDSTGLTYNATTDTITATSSYANQSRSSSFASTSSFVNPLNQNVTINGNLTVTGTSSINFISQSTLNIATNLITVNTNTPTVRFGGLAVLDSGSSPQRSGSILLDSVNDQWIFVHQNTGGAVTSSVFLQGPQTYNNIGNETNLTVNRLPKSVLAEHLGDSNITDNGTFVSINSNSQITGSLIVSAGITGSLFGTSSNSTIAATASKVITGLVTTNATHFIPFVDTNHGTTGTNFLGTVGGLTYNPNNGALTASFFQGTASFATSSSRAISSSFATSASWAPAVSSNPFPFTGSATITGSLTLTGSLRGQVSALSIASNTASMNVGSNNFFTLTLVDGTTTHISASNIQPGQTINLRVTQGASGTGQVSFQSAIDQPSGSAYTPTLFANAVDIITFVSFDTSALYLSYIKRLI